MSYIPDFRHEEGKLTKEDRLYYEGYKAGLEDAKQFFYNTDVYDATDEEKKVMEDPNTIECFEDWCEQGKVDFILSLFESGKVYENVELKDANPPMYNLCGKNSLTKGK